MEQQCLPSRLSGMGVSTRACKPLPVCLVAFFSAPVVGLRSNGPASLFWARGLERCYLQLCIFNSSFQRMWLLRRASKGALFAPVSNHDVTEMGGGCSAPNTWREVGSSFHFLFYFWLLNRYLTSLPFQGAAVCDSWRRSCAFRVCVKRPEAGGAAHVAVHDAGAGGPSGCPSVCTSKSHLIRQSLSHSLWKDPLGDPALAVCGQGQPSHPGQGRVGWT